MVVAVTLTIGIVARAFFFAPGVVGALQLLAFVVVGVSIGTWLFLRLHPIEEQPDPIDASNSTLAPQKKS